MSFILLNKLCVAPSDAGTNFGVKGNDSDTRRDDNVDQSKDWARARACPRRRFGGNGRDQASPHSPLSGSRLRSLWAGAGRRAAGFWILVEAWPGQKGPGRNRRRSDSRPEHGCNPRRRARTHLVILPGDSRWYRTARNSNCAYRTRPTAAGPRAGRTRPAPASSRSDLGERVLERTPGRRRAAGRADHVDEGAQRGRDLTVPGIV
jgi:hypothetical protein